MLRKIIFTLAAITIVHLNNHAQSQIDSLDQFLGSYARPDFVRRSLDLRPSISSFIANDLPGQTSASNRLSIGGSAKYIVTKNSDRWQSTNSYYLDTNFATRENQGTEAVLNSTVEFNSRYFFAKDRYLAFYNRVNGTLGTAETTNRISSFNDIGIGFGRVEQVSDAIHVSRLFDMLECAGILLKEVSVTDLEVLTDTVAVLKNRRFFDSRLQRIREMEIVTKILSEMGYIEQGDFYSYAILTDAYVFEQASLNFQSGNALEILIGRDFGYLQDFGWTSADDARLTVRWERNRVRSKYWSYQTDIGNTFAYRETEDVPGGRYRCLNNTYLSHKIYYSPTRRILMSWQNSANLAYNILESDFIDQTDKDLNFSSAGSIDYYISPQLRLSAVARASVNSTLKEGEGTYRSFNFNVSMLYSYF